MQQPNARLKLIGAFISTEILFNKQIDFTTYYKRTAFNERIIMMSHIVTGKYMYLSIFQNWTIDSSSHHLVCKRQLTVCVLWYSKEWPWIMVITILFLGHWLWMWYNTMWSVWHCISLLLVLIQTTCSPKFFSSQHLLDLSLVLDLLVTVGNLMIMIKTVNYYP